MIYGREYVVPNYVAEHLGVSSAAVLKQIRQGKLPAGKRERGKGSYWVRRDFFEIWKFAKSVIENGVTEWDVLMATCDRYVILARPGDETDPSPVLLICTVRMGAVELTMADVESHNRDIGEGDIGREVESPYLLAVELIRHMREKRRDLDWIDRKYHLREDEVDRDWWDEQYGEFGAGRRLYFPRRHFLRESAGSGSQVSGRQYEW
jgi:hypothetical protein